MIQVVKIGGGIIDNDEQLDVVLDSIARANHDIILVHGGGRLATDVATELGIEQQMIDGRRVTSLETLRVVTMTYAGWINKQLVAKLQSRGVGALGMTGADGNLIQSNIRPKEPIDFGYVGDPINVNQTLIAGLFEALQLTSKTGFGCLVVAPITHDGNGTLLNTNADTIAADLALAFAPHSELLFAFEHSGVLSDVANPDSALKTVSAQQAEEMIENGSVNTGMLPKLSNALRASAGRVSKVRIARFDALDNEEGTWIS